MLNKVRHSRYLHVAQDKTKHWDVRSYISVVTFRVVQFKAYQRTLCICMRKKSRLCFAIAVVMDGKLFLNAVNLKLKFTVGSYSVKKGALTIELKLSKATFGYVHINLNSCEIYISLINIYICR